MLDVFQGSCLIATPEAVEYQLIQETIYPYAYVYDGDAEVVIATFRSEPFTPVAWQAEKLAATAKEEIEKDGRKVLEMRVYADISPVFWTDFRIEIVTTPPPQTVTGYVWWQVLILILAAIGLVIAIKIGFESFTRMFKHKPINEKIKKAMSREWLILTIGEFEEKLIAMEKLPGPPTLPEELEKMSDQALRDYCDELAEIIAPPGIGLPGWIAIGIAGAVAVGAIAFATRK